MEIECLRLDFDVEYTWKSSLRHSISNRNFWNLTLSPISLSLISQTPLSVSDPLSLTLSFSHSLSVTVTVADADPLTHWPSQPHWSDLSLSQTPLSVSASPTHSHSPSPSLTLSASPSPTPAPTHSPFQPHRSVTLSLSRSLTHYRTSLSPSLLSHSPSVVTQSPVYAVSERKRKKKKGESLMHFAM